MRCFRELWRFLVATEEGSLLDVLFRGLMGTNYSCSTADAEVLAAYLNEVRSGPLMVPPACRLGSLVAPGVLD